MLRFSDPSFMVLIGAIIGIVGGLVSGVGAYRAASMQSKEQAALRQKADEVADSQRELRKKSDEIASLYKTIAASQTELKNKADEQADSQRMLREKSDEIAILNREIGKNQIKLREKSDEIASLANDSLKSITGGDSYCFLSYIDPGQGNEVLLVVNHVGNYPLYDVNIRIVDVATFKRKMDAHAYYIEDLQKDKTISLASMTPNFSTMTFDKLILPGSGEMELNMFITARNGYWVQTLKLKRIEGKLKQRTTLKKSIGAQDTIVFEQNDF